jgi:hypothetical protein
MAMDNISRTRRHVKHCKENMKNIFKNFKTFSFLKKAIFTLRAEIDLMMGAVCTSETSATSMRLHSAIFQKAVIFKHNLFTEKTVLCYCIPT